MAVAALLLVTACSGQPSPPSASPSASTKRTQEFTTTFTLRTRSFYVVGQNNEKTFGWSRYRGRTQFLGEAFRVQMLVASDFVRSNGTFEGFVNLTSDSGDIGLRITGVAQPGPQGDGSSYSGETEVIGGTRTYATLAGRGRFTGQRTGGTGTPIDVVVTLELINPSEER
jgi:hypothetical protein